MGVFFIIFAKDFNYYALIVVAFGLLIRLWASGYIHKSQEVTASGPYKLIRHPLYLGNFICGLGFAFFVNVWWLVVVYIPVFLIVYYKKMKLEEEFLISKFGEQYKEYQKTTNLFIPNPTKLLIRDTNKFSWKCYIHNREHLNLIGGILILLFCLAYQEYAQDYLFSLIASL